VERHRNGRSGANPRLTNLPSFLGFEQVSTYKYVAESLDSPKAYRAVGNALRQNPFAPFVPCHRVLASDGTIGGFAGSVGETPLILRKQSMLQAEGVEFDPTTRALKRDPSYRSKVILQKIDSKGIDSLLEDDHLMKM
jgi:O-6-methylguanine DNA methyltransferase